MDLVELVFAKGGEMEAKTGIKLGNEGEIAAYVADESLDFVYVDAAHDYGAMKEDLQLWWPKIRVSFGSFPIIHCKPFLCRASSIAGLLATFLSARLHSYIYENDQCMSYLPNELTPWRGGTPQQPAGRSHGR